MSRREIVHSIAAVLASVRREHPVRVGITGLDAAGKTTLADELAVSVELCGRRTVRASIDDFYRPGHRVRAEARGYTPRTYYEQAFDYAALQARLLRPLGPGGDRRVRLASWNMIDDIDVPDREVVVVSDAVLLVDGVFLLHPALRSFWDVLIWIEIDTRTSLARARVRDLPLFGTESQLHDRYEGRNFPAHDLYVCETGGAVACHIVIDNTAPQQPMLIRMQHAYSEAPEGSE